MLSLIRTDKNRNQMIKDKLIKGLYISKSTYVHSPTPCSHAEKMDGKMQTTTDKAILNYIEREIYSRICTSID